MTEPTDILDVWERDRAYVTDLAFRMLGHIQDAEDVVQDAFGRLLGRDLDEIDDVRGWLVVVVTRLCLDQLRSARHRHAAGSSPDDVRPADASAPDPADRVSFDDSVRIALLVVLRQLRPAERVVFVLHDVFQFSFDAIAPMVGRTPAACRQLASRGRRRLRAATAANAFDPDVREQHRIARRFIEACAGGDLDGLLELLDADVSGDVDLGRGAPQFPLRGAEPIARRLLGFYGPTSGARLVSQPVSGEPGVLAFLDGRLVGILQLVARAGGIVDIHAVADPAQLAGLDVALHVAAAR
jgi:RNA polymerase sigma-70 factor (ECF subfamily)